jgi:DNA-binding NarL/FixJ family response regulator
MPQLDAVYEADDLTSALKATSDLQPALVMLDLLARRNGEDAWLTVRRVKAKWPQARCIFLANDVQQQREAEAAGADVVLLQGFPAPRLVAAMVKLLPHPVT